MRTKNFNERCERIFNFFNHLNDSSDYTQEVPIVNLIFPNSFYDQLHIVISKDKNNEFKVEEIVDLAGPISEVAFAIGYVIGQSFEITFSDAKNDVEAIKKIIREKQLLPYLLKERRGAWKQKN